MSDFFFFERANLYKVKFGKITLVYNSQRS